MGRLAGFKYRKIIKVLREFGFEFHRQATGSHEIWFNSETNRYTTIQKHPGDLPEGTLRAYFEASKYYTRRCSTKSSLASAIAPPLPSVDRTKIFQLERSLLGYL